MNHIYRSIWSDALGTWIAVSEVSKGQSKRTVKRQKLWAASLLVCSTPVFALPTGNQLVAGQATVATPTATQMQINQGSQRAVINWQGFSVGHHDTVNIKQPNANAALLNRVVGQDASQIQGKLNANGQVYLVNPNGVVFSKTAQVDVGGLVATTHQISNQDFMNGKHHFTQNGAKGVVENHGSIKTSEHGVVALIGEKVTNTGNIETPKGTTALAAGKTVDLDFQGDGLVEVKVSEAALNAQINNRGAIQADGGRVVMTAKAANQLIDTVINQEGIVKARGMVERNGEIILEGDAVIQSGTLDASGKTGGKVDINARAILDTGKTNADGTDGKGGQINMKASDAIIQTASADTHANGTTTGGTVHLEGTHSVFSSGKLNAKGEQGGTIDVVSKNRVALAAAELDASGEKQGGLVRVGGDFHGANTKLPNAKTTIINGSTKIKANGGKGKVVVWSDEKTDYYGSISANKAGDIEISSKGTLTYAGSADAGQGGNLLLDPKNIIITNSDSVASYSIFDPHPAADNWFGYKTVVLGNTINGLFSESGNIVVSSTGDDLIAAESGAAYLFNRPTGALIATLTGATSFSYTGEEITALTNGNYIVHSARADTNVDLAGAVTWGHGLTGVSGIVSSNNSLLGSSANDWIGYNGGVVPLANGNYLVVSPGWDNGTVIDVGAVTWANGTTGISGYISSTNSLIGSTANDYVGGGKTISTTSPPYYYENVTALDNGNYVVGSAYWDNGALTDVGAATWGNGFIGITGIISSTNSLIGTLANDMVSDKGITALTNGNYVVNSSNWANGTAFAAGAATWGDGLAGLTGFISSTNSLVGATINEMVALNGSTALKNGHYVVGTPNWDNGTISGVGAVTWADGTVGLSGYISATNSLIGSSQFDWIGSRIDALSNGNYVTSSLYWDNGSIVDVGAVTWAAGDAPTVGVVSSTNSLIGSIKDDWVGSNGVTALANGNYVVSSPYWDNGAVVDVGAATWGDGVTGTAGLVSSSNSLIGSSLNDNIGLTGITALKNGNYVVTSQYWDNGSVIDAGAVTWADGTIPTATLVSSINSFIGTASFDWLGNAGVTALPDGNYVVTSQCWNGTKGAVTWGDGRIGSSGFLNTSNSLTGVGTGDFLNILRVNGLNSGNYIVSSGYWDNGSLVDAGQVRVVTPFNIHFEDGLGQTMTFNPNQLANTLANGTNIMLEANNDIILDVGADIIVNGSAAGSLTLKAGRNITLNSSIFTGNGNFTAIAGFISPFIADRDFGIPTLTLGAGANIDAGTGKVVLSVINGRFINNTNTSAAAFTNSVFAVSAAALTTSPINASQWWIYSTDPSLNVLNGLVADFKHYGQSYNGFTPSYATVGNWFLYAVTPILSVAPLPQTVTYGTPTNFIPTFTGFIDGDTAITAGINGVAQFDQTGVINPVGNYDVNYIGGLSSNLGYVLVNNIASINELTVLPALLSVTPAPTQTIDYGATPVSFKPSLTGFVNGETFSSAGITGLALFNINGFTGNVGSYDVSYLGGLSSRNYIFADNMASINELTINAIVTSNSPSQQNPIQTIVADFLPKANDVLPNDTYPVIEELIISPILMNTQALESQSTPLQISTEYLFKKEYIFQVEDPSQMISLIDTENDGMKLPTKLHRVISMFLSCSI